MRVWVCDCGCVSGYLYEDGRFLCANCQSEAISSPAFMEQAVVEKRIVDRKDAFKIVDMNSSLSALHRIVNNLQRRQDEVVGAIILYANGSHSNWFTLEGSEQCDWAKRHLDEIKEYIDAKFRDQSAIRQGGAEDS
jgi:hypothetical protein